MPYPRNLEVAFEVEAVIRRYGAVPATCAVINGRTSMSMYVCVNACTWMCVNVFVCSSVDNNHLYSAYVVCK